MSVCRFEDGTLPFLEILAVKHGFDTLYSIAGQFDISMQFMIHLSSVDDLAIYMLFLSILWELFNLDVL